MKKSLIALAVAGAFAAPAMAATSNVDVYGRMDVAIQDTNATNSDIQVTDNVSRLGFKGSEDLGGGLKAIWQIESQLNAGGNDGLDGAGTIGGRNTFVGLAGGFGTFLMGRHDTPYKLGTSSLDIFSDTIGDYNGRLMGVDPVNATHDMRSGNAIAYITPTVGGFHAAAAVVASNDAAGLNNNNKSFDAFSLTGVYANGPLFASLSYQKAYDVTATTSSTTYSCGAGQTLIQNTTQCYDTGTNTIVAATGATTTTGVGNQGSSAWKLGLGYTFGDAKVGFIYEDINNDAGGLNGGIDRSSWTLNGAYNMGPIVLKAQYAKINDFGAKNVDPTKWDLGVDYNLSKRTKAYFVYSSVNDDVAGTKNLNGYNIGLQHNF